MFLYFKSVLMHLKCELEYKVSFVLMCISSLLSSFFAIIGTVILIKNFNLIDGWSINEILFTTGIALLGYSVTEMFGRGLDHFHEQVKKGTLDRILLRPRSITLQVLCMDFEGTKIGRVVESIILVAYSTLRLKIEWTLYKVLVFIFIIAGGCTLFFGILLLKASFSFWTIEGMEAMNIISAGGKELSSYPISIYKKWFSAIFTYVIPFGCINYYPLLYLLRQK